MFKKFLILCALLPFFLAILFIPPQPEESGPCEAPLFYSVGLFDRRFGLSFKDALLAMNEAEALWEKASGRNLFEYAPEGGLKINFFYDERQRVTEELELLEKEVQADEALYRSLETEYAALKSAYALEKSGYDSAILRFEEESRGYEMQVSRWNTGSRRSRAEFEKIEQERRRLEKEFSAIRVLEEKLNDTVEKLNRLAGRLNRMARELNLRVDEYNAIGVSRGETFTGGSYYQDGQETHIDIYEFENREKLVRILAHELGHALGLDHIEDKESIMYKLNQGEVNILTAADLMALEKRCAVK